MAAEATLDVRELLDKARDSKGYELLRTLVKEVVQSVLEAERDEQVGAARYERGGGRQDIRSGYKPRTLKTIVGEIDLQKPQTRNGFQSEVLERYSRVDQSVLTMAAEMYARGVSTRKVEDLLEDTIGVSVSAETVSRANKRLDLAISGLKRRPLGATPVLILDARFDKVRRDGAIRSTALLVAVGIEADGQRRVLDFWVAEGETGWAWKDLLTSMRKRGLKGVAYVVSDDHEGLRTAVEEVFVGAIWQRCQEHTKRNIRCRTPKSLWPEIKANLKDLYDAPDEAKARERLAALVKHANRLKRGLGDYIGEVVPDGLAVFALPVALRRRLRTTNMLERVNEEIKRRTKVARIFPSSEAYERCAGTILVHVDEKWQASERSYLDLTLLLEKSGGDGQGEDLKKAA